MTLAEVNKLRLRSPGVQLQKGPPVLAKLLRSQGCATIPFRRFWHDLS